MTRIKNIFFVSLCFLISLTATAQNFQGKIVYQNTYKSKIPNVPDAQFTAMMGQQQEYLIKGSNYKSTMNGTMMQWQIYRGDDNKLYIKTANSPVIYWKDGSENPDEVKKAEINKGVVTIAGYLCDELVLTCKSGVQKYYFNPKIKVDPSQFANHKFGNWSEVVSRTKALPLKIVVDTPQVTIESEATEVSEARIDDKEFALPPDSQLQKSPY